MNNNWFSLSEFRHIWLKVVVSCVCEFIILFYIALCSFGAVYKFVCRLAIYGDHEKDGLNQNQWSKENSWSRYKATSQSLDTDEDPLIASVLRIIAKVHRQLDLFKTLGVDTIFELGLLSVEPTHTGRGMQTCLIAGYRRNYVPLLTACYLFWKWHDTAWLFHWA